MTVDYTALREQLAAAGANWIEVQEDNDVQTRHMIRRDAILQVTEVLEAPRAQVSARILDTR